METINGWTEADRAFLAAKVGMDRRIIDSFCDRVSKERYFAMPVERRIKAFKEHFLATLKRRDLDGLPVDPDAIKKGKPIKW